MTSNGIRVRLRLQGRSHRPSWLRNLETASSPLGRLSPPACRTDPVGSPLGLCSLTLFSFQTQSNPSRSLMACQPGKPHSPCQGLPEECAWALLTLASESQGSVCTPGERFLGLKNRPTESGGPSSTTRYIMFGCDVWSFSKHLVAMRGAVAPEESKTETQKEPGCLMTWQSHHLTVLEPSYLRRLFL